MPCAGRPVTHSDYGAVCGCVCRSDDGSPRRSCSIEPRHSRDEMWVRSLALQCRDKMPSKTTMAACVMVGRSEQVKDKGVGGTCGQREGRLLGQWGGGAREWARRG